MADCAKFELIRSFGTLADWGAKVDLTLPLVQLYVRSGLLRVKARRVIGHAATISPGEFIQASEDWINDRTQVRNSAPGS
jgi:hypothetical protein